jgi:DNA-binding beta-propeller fold protein YncE
VKRLSLVLLALGACARETPASDPPPPWGVPISGGTMLVTRDGTSAVIADPDRDRVMIVDLTTGDSKQLALAAGDEPGRLVEDGSGRIHVALRRGGAVLTIADGQIVARRAVCGEPRGLAWDSAHDLIHVACTGGELVTLPAAGGDPTRVLRLDRDLRDVIVQGDSLLVTRFRTAELLTVDATGIVSSRISPPTVQRIAPCDSVDCGGVGSGSGTGSGSGSGPSQPLVDALPAVAWRAIALPDGRTLIAHQRQLDATLNTMHGGYDGTCGQGPVEDAFTVVGAPGTAPVAVAPFAVGALPVDIAVDTSGTRIAVVSAGMRTVTVANSISLEQNDDDQCGDNGLQGSVFNDQLGAPTSVAFDPTGNLYVYYPELPALVEHGNPDRWFVLPGPFGYDAGRGLFHTSAALSTATNAPAPGGAAGSGAGPGFLGFGGADLACASCHPEGRDDGRVWKFADEGSRRTQSLAGSILARAPYHWAGDEPDLPTLMDDVFTNRMAGDAVTRSQHMSLGRWLDRVPAPVAPPPADPAAVARGSAVFAATCTGCHSGPLFTTKALVDVGTGGKFKVPSLLGIGNRAPYLHDGCAATLADRFGPCGGGAHGNTADLGPSQIADLVAYLETL